MTRPIATGVIDLSVDQVQPLQVAPNTFIVKGKPTGFEVTIRSSKTTGLPNDVDIELSVDGRTVSTTVQSSNFRPVGDHFELTTVVVPKPGEQPLVLASLGVLPVQVTVDPQQAINDPNRDNNSKHTTINVVLPKSLSLVYIPVKGPVLPRADCAPICYQTPVKFDDTKVTSEEFIRKVYPVTDKTFHSVGGGIMTAGFAGGIDVTVDLI